MRRLEPYASPERILQCARAAIGAEARMMAGAGESAREAIAILLEAELLRRAGVGAPVIGFLLDLSDRRCAAALDFMIIECGRRPEVDRRLSEISAELPRLRREAA